MKVSIIFTLESLGGPLNGPSCTQLFDWGVVLTTSLSRVRSSIVFPVQVVRDELPQLLCLSLAQQAQSRDIVSFP